MNRSCHILPLPCSAPIRADCVLNADSSWCSGSSWWRVGARGQGGQLFQGFSFVVCKIGPDDCSKKVSVLEWQEDPMPKAQELPRDPRDHLSHCLPECLDGKVWRSSNKTTMKPGPGMQDACVRICSANLLRVNVCQGWSLPLQSVCAWMIF